MDGPVTCESDANQEALELRKARRRERQRRYRKTEKGQAAHKRYWQSKKGKRTTKRANRSPKRREAQKRYWSSLKGQQNRKRYRIRRKARQSETTSLVEGRHKSDDGDYRDEHQVVRKPERQANGQAHPPRATLRPQPEGSPQPRR